MGEIKDLGVFQNRGLDRIKERTKNKSAVSPTPKKDIIEEKKEINSNQDINNQKERPQVVVKKRTVKRRLKSNGAGAPIKKFDRVYATSQPIKLSALLNSTGRILSEKYMAGDSKDEILRKALNDYVKHNLTKEDKRALLNDVQKDLDIFRAKNPTIEKIDEDGNVLQSSEEIENQTLEELKNSWGI